MIGPYDTHTVTNPDALARLAPEWEALWQAAGRATPFQSPAWQIPWWDCFAPGELHVVTVRCKGRLMCLAPLYLNASKGCRRLLPIGVSITDYLDILVHPADPFGATAALASHLDSDGDWGSLEWPDLPDGAIALSMTGPLDCEDSVERTSPCPVLALPATVEALKDIFPARKRRTLRMVRNRADRRGAVRMLSLADRRPEAMLTDLYRLHALRWRSRGQPGVLDDERVRRFHLRAAPKLAELGVLRLYAIEIAGEIAAVYYGFIRGRCAYGYLTGLDPSFAFESPGTLTIAHAIEEAVREGAREFHFLRGGEPYKCKWGAQDRWNYRRVFERVAHHAGLP
jgi:CelD/BcsL family acetyltransferase involved in cellulose biosynthesis